jgi:hypothetical protein
MRQFRTVSSEGYAIMERDVRIGRVDLHFATEKVYATIVLEREMVEAEVASIIEEIDNNLVISATVKREDLNVWVYTGREMGFFTDQDPYLDEDDFEDEDEELDDLDEDDLDEDDLDDIDEEDEDLT